MQITILQAKIRNATVTGANHKYKGSITIDEDLMDELGVVEWQVVTVNAMAEDQYGRGPFRGQTYVLKGERGTGEICANGALARFISKGDIVHINVYALMDSESAKTHKPIIIEKNIIR